MKIIEEILLVEHNLTANVYVNGYDHVSEADCDEVKYFHDKDEADKYIINENDADYLITNDVTNNLEVEVDEIKVDRSMKGVSIDDMLSDIYLRHYLNAHIESHNLEIKEMKCELDGVVSVKKVLVEKLEEVA